MKNIPQVSTLLKPSRVKRTNSRQFRQMGTTADVLFAAAEYLDTEGQLLAAHLLHKKAMTLLQRRSQVVDAKYATASA